MTRCYIAGPMSGLPEMNFPAFAAAARDLRARGWDAVSPAEVNPDPGMTWHEAMKRDIPALLTCEAVVVLPGWEKSRGAKVEVGLARDLDMPVYLLAEALAFEVA